MESKISSKAVIKTAFLPVTMIRPVFSACITVLVVGLLAVLHPILPSLLGNSRPWPDQYALPTITSGSTNRRREGCSGDSIDPSVPCSSYSRYSSNLQSEESIVDQQRKCGEKAVRNGHRISREFEFDDEAISGTKRHRAGLDAMLAAAEAGRIKVLYFYSLSRLSRESVITLPLLKHLVYNCGVRIISVTEGIDSNDTAWELIAHIMSIVHEQYLKDLAANVLRGQEGGNDPLAAIRSINALASADSSAILVLVNFHRFLSSAETIQALAQQISDGKQSRAFIVVLSPVVQIPVELEKLMVVIEHELPGREQLEQIARGIATENGELPEGDDLQTVLDAAAGLTRYEAEGAFSLSLVRHSAIRPEAIWELKQGMLEEKWPASVAPGR